MSPLPHHALRAVLKSSAAALGALLIAQTPATANPLDGKVTTGSASIANSATATTVHQTSEGVVIDWSSFDVGKGQTTTFSQPNAQAIAVNRIGGASASQIIGTLDANGRIVLINDNGLLFGKGSQVNVGSLVATSSDASNSDLLSGKTKFSKAGSASATIVNDGKITAAKGGLVALVAPSVTNAGTINAKLGTVSLGGASKFTVDFTGDGLVSFAAKSTSTGQVANSGKLSGASITLTARSAEGLAAGAVNVSGIVDAQTAHAKGGTIVLDAGDGGDISLASAHLSASGKSGGGSVQIGGWNENSVVVDKASVIDASASNTGNGGSIGVLASATSFRGQALAQGGAQSGHGGKIETSGHVLDTTGAGINTLAAHGATGSWTLDPENVTISSGTTSNGGISSGVFTPTGDNSVLNAGDLETALGSTNITVTTGSTGHQSGDITVAANVSWSSAFSLTLSALRNINIDNSVTIASTGAGGVTLYSDDKGHSIGTVTFGTSSQVRSTGGGSVDIFYNPTDYAHPVDYGRTDVYVTGGGTFAAYMLVNTLDELQNIGFNADQAQLSQDYALGRNIDASATANWYSGAGFEPIGNYSTPFEGAFDGLNHSITNLTINRPTQSTVGLFGYADGVANSLGNVGTPNAIFDLRLVNVSISGYNDVGAVAGDLEEFGTLTNISVTGSITGYGAVGGLVGDSYANSAYKDRSGADVIATAGSAGGLLGYEEFGNITDSSATGSVSGASDIGGLVGSISENSAISDSWASGNVTSTAADGILVGGLVGMATGNLTNDHASGTVIGGAGGTGGLAGYLLGNLTGSYATGNVSAPSGGSNPSTEVGGLIGVVGNGSPILIADSHATGTVSGNSQVGGLIGFLDAGSAYTLEKIYATGDVTATGSDIGGLIGDSRATLAFAEEIKYAYATGTVSGGTNVGGFVGESVRLKVRDSYATGNVSGNANVGGFAGTTPLNSGSSDFYYTYASGAVTGTTDVGGFVGSQIAKINFLDSYWTTDAAGTEATQGTGNGASEPNLVGLTTAEFQSGLPTGFSASVWGSNPGINDEFPYLLALPPA